MAALHYLEGGRQGDIERLHLAFHPGARLQFVKNGEYGEWPVAEYISWQRPGRESGAKVRVLSLDFAGSCAMVKAEVDYGDKRFIDFLSLLKIEGRWRIVNKIFHREEAIRREARR